MLWFTVTGDNLPVGVWRRLGHERESSLHLYSPGTVMPLIASAEKAKLACNACPSIITLICLSGIRKVAIS